MSTFRVQFPPMSQKQNIPRAKIQTGFNESSDRQLLRAFGKENKTNKHQERLSLKSREYCEKMLLAVKGTTSIYLYTLKNDIQ